MPLTEADCKTLLDYSRRVLERCLLGDPAPLLQNPSPALLTPAGAFVTLRHHDGELRGCIGRVTATEPLFQTVADCAVEAATRDPRFNPVGAEELPQLRIEISVLSPLTEIDPDQIVPGRHGLLVSLGWRRGLLLPQVATERGWERERFLAETCVKAGLSPDAWRHGATVQAFTAEVFGESQNALEFEAARHASGAASG